MTANHPISIGCVLMAAGDASRFGENKLTASLNGKSLIRYALESIPADHLAAVCVVTQYDEIRELAKQFGFLCIRNDHPGRGISETIRLGTLALQETCQAILYQVADQPFLCRESIQRLIGLFRSHPDRIVSASHNGVRGNPCIFPEKYFPELCALEGDRGGSLIIRRHPEALLLCDIDPHELADIDTKEALLRLMR